MSRSQKNARRGNSRSASVERKPTPTGEGKGAGVTKRSGTERPDPATGNPKDMADPVARVIRTRS